MTVSPTVVLLSIAIGVPLMLLALGVLYHAWVLSQRHESLDERVESLALGGSDELLLELQTTMQELQGSLQRQRTSMGQMLSTPPRPETAAAMPGAGSYTSSRPDPGSEATTDLRAAVRQLTAEGLSDRAIARRLHVGVEEVRMARGRIVGRA